MPSPPERKSRVAGGGPLLGIESSRNTPANGLSSAGFQPLTGWGPGVPGAPVAFRCVDMMHPFKSFLWGKDLAVLDHGLAGDCGTFSAPGPLVLHRQG